MAVMFVEYRTGKTINEVMAEKGVLRNPSAFTDTSDPYILAAYALGITTGVGGNRFDPSGSINRQQAATMLMRVCGVLGIDTDNPPASGFTDMSNAQTWAVNGINFCYANGIMQGTGNNNFSPNTPYQRQQSIVTFDRIG